MPERPNQPIRRQKVHRFESLLRSIPHAIRAESNHPPKSHCRDVPVRHGARLRVAWPIARWTGPLPELWVWPNCYCRCSCRVWRMGGDRMWRSVRSCRVPSTFENEPRRSGGSSLVGTDICPVCQLIAQLNSSATVLPIPATPATVTWNGLLPHSSILPGVPAAGYESRGPPHC